MEASRLNTFSAKTKHTRKRLLKIRPKTINIKYWLCALHQHVSRAVIVYQQRPCTKTSDVLFVGHDGRTTQHGYIFILTWATSNWTYVRKKQQPATSNDCLAQWKACVQPVFWLCCVQVLVSGVSHWQKKKETVSIWIVVQSYDVIRPLSGEVMRNNFQLVFYAIQTHKPLGAIVQNGPSASFPTLLFVLFLCLVVSGYHIQWGCTWPLLMVYRVNLLHKH